MNVELHVYQENYKLTGADALKYTLISELMILNLLLQFDGTMVLKLLNIQGLQQ